MPPSRKNKPGKYPSIPYEIEFNVDAYIGNPYMIKQLYAEKMTASIKSENLEKELESWKKDYHQLELVKKDVEHARDEAKRTIEQLVITKDEIIIVRDSLSSQIETLKATILGLELGKQKAEHDQKHAEENLGKLERKSLPKYLFTTLGVVIASIGINLATSMPGNWIAWTLVVTGVLLGLAAFFIIGRDN